MYWPYTARLQSSRHAPSYRVADSPSPRIAFKCADVSIVRLSDEAEPSRIVQSSFLTSPVSLIKVVRLASLFLAIKVIATLGQRHFGGAGFDVVSGVGGLVSSASSTAAAASLTLRHTITPSEAGIATVLTSIASALMSLSMVQCQKRTWPAIRELMITSALQIGAGVATTLLQSHIFRIS